MGEGWNQVHSSATPLTTGEINMKQSWSEIQDEYYHGPDYDWHVDMPDSTSYLQRRHPELYTIWQDKMAWFTKLIDRCGDDQHKIEQLLDQIPTFGDFVEDTKKWFKTTP
jgi:hypothetical protein